MKVVYTGAFADCSGYAEAARNYAKALLKIPSIDLTVQVVSFESFKTDINLDFLKPIAIPQKPVPSMVDVNIIHLTPENFERKYIPAKKRIGVTVWETDKLPDRWIDLCNSMNEIWVPCQWNKECFIKSGVTVPVKILNHCYDPIEFENTTKTEISNQIDNTCFNFYSIFQWSERKNPEGLITGYLSEFNHDEKVCLVVKTYAKDNSEADKQLCIDLIKKVKNNSQLTNTPKITLLHGGMSRQDMLSIHNSCDCFVLPHRAEGWGVPHFEALACGKPVISTGYSGNLEFQKYENSWLLSFHETPVTKMNRPTYHSKMSWAEPSIQNLKDSMREAFTNRELLKSKGASGKEYIKKFSIDQIALRIKDLLNEA